MTTANPSSTKTTSSTSSPSRKTSTIFWFALPVFTGALTLRCWGQAMLCWNRLLKLHASIDETRSCAALWAADPDWIFRPGLSLGRYILRCSQCLASCLRHSARIGVLIFRYIHFFVNDRGFPTDLLDQAWESAHFSSLTGGSNWLKVTIFRDKQTSSLTGGSN